MSYIIVTIDVEDWFQVENLKGCIPFESWSSYDFRVERNTDRLLDLLDSYVAFDQMVEDKSGFGCRVEATPGNGLTHANGKLDLVHRPTKATFFVLGWIANRLPHLVQEIHRRGHEVASHGYNHKLCTGSSLAELTADLRDSKKKLEDLIGAPVRGYRAPSFSITDAALRVLQDVGYEYDSSLNNCILNSRYGSLNLRGFNKRGIATEIAEGFYELPVGHLELCGQSFSLGGGAVFRLLPMSLFLAGVNAILKKHHGYVFYLHPWEIDPEQPRVTGLPLGFRVRHYSNLKSTFDKLKYFLTRLRRSCFVTCSEYLVDVKHADQP